MTIEIIKKSDNKSAWSNSYLNKVLNATIENLNNIGDPVEKIYLIKCADNRHIDFDPSWVTCYISLTDARVIK